MNKPNAESQYFEPNLSLSEPSWSVLDEQYQPGIPLRYGTNPHQKAILYNLKDRNLAIGGMKILKTGKSGLSQTNIEDVNYAVRILKYLKQNAVAIMKHLNPCGVAMGSESTELWQIYLDAYQVDPRAAFGSVVVFNCTVDAKTATDMMQHFVELVAAPKFDDDAIQILNDVERFKRNKHLRVVQFGDEISLLGKYMDENQENKSEHWDMKILEDGSMIASQAYRTRIRNANDFVIAKAIHPEKGDIECVVNPSKTQYNDLLFAWYVNLGLRSNGIVIVKDGVTLALGTGEQDRIGALEQAIDKAHSKYQGRLDLRGAVLASDGFFPFSDSIELLADVGIAAVVQPGGAKKDYAVIETCNRHGIAMVFSQERCFAHH